MAINYPDYAVKGKVALITGAGRGIGRACALALSKAGADIALGLRDVATGEELAEEIRSHGNAVYPVTMDMNNVAQIRTAVAAVQEHYGRIDILVNNVGIGAPNLIEEVTETDFDATIAVNLKGTFFATQAVGRIMIAQNSGKIVNIGSQAGVIALPSESVYCMTKAAISHLTKCTALEWAKYNIHVNTVAPTFIRTPGTVKWLADSDFEQSVINRIPLGHIGEPMDVAGAVVFLSSSASNLITGTTLLIDGGWTLA